MSDISLYMRHTTLYIALTAAQSGASVSAKNLLVTHHLMCDTSLYMCRITLYVALTAAKSGASVIAKYSFIWVNSPDV